MSAAPQSYVVATIKTWNIELFHKTTPGLPGTWHLITDPAKLTLARLRALRPRYVFFPHWSQIVLGSIVEQFECVCFHMTDVPYGRGGSPLQNLILRGHTHTQLTALRMTEAVDAGPVYFKRPLDLDGRAEDIYRRAAALSYAMMEEIVRMEPVPREQEGEPVLFTRRRPAQSLLPEQGNSKALYDHIRMLDADTYPRAFIDYGDWRLEFRDAALTPDGVDARVRLSRRKDKDT
jgi:methionyl-tRNA formyltransferase